MTAFHHGVTATETSAITPIMKSVSMSTIALVSTSIDADNTHYPLDTPVLLSGITTEDVTKAGSKDTLLYQNLRTIKAIQNTSVVVLRLSDPAAVDTVDLLLGCQTRLGVTPKILCAPEIDTPAMTRKLVEIAKKRRAFVYTSPRRDDGTLLTDKIEISAYRDTFAARELMLIEGGFGEPASTPDSAPVEGSDWDGSLSTLPLLPFVNHVLMSETASAGGKYITVSRNGGAFNTYQTDDYFSENTALIEDIIYAQNALGTSIAFVHLPEMVARQTGLISICGINADGTVNAPEDQALSVLDANIESTVENGFIQRSTAPHTTRLERNWITFKPTPSVDPSVDMYYLLEGSDSKAWIIVESAAAIDLGAIELP